MYNNEYQDIFNFLRKIKKFVMEQKGKKYSPTIFKLTEIDEELVSYKNHGRSTRRNKKF